MEKARLAVGAIFALLSLAALLFGAYYVFFSPDVPRWAVGLGLLIVSYGQIQKNEIDD